MEKNLELYSDNKRNLEIVDIFVYDTVSDKFKNNIFYFIQSNVTNTELSQIYSSLIIGHGQGSETRELSVIYAEYALQVAASNILLLIGINNESI